MSPENGSEDVTKTLLLLVASGFVVCLFLRLLEYIAFNLIKLIKLFAAVVVLTTFVVLFLGAGAFCIFCAHLLINALVALLKLAVVVLVLYFAGGGRWNGLQNGFWKAHKHLANFIRDIRQSGEHYK